MQFHSVTLVTNTVLVSSLGSLPTIISHAFLRTFLDWDNTNRTKGQIFAVNRKQDERSSVILNINHVIVSSLIDKNEYMIIDNADNSNSNIFFSSITSGPRIRSFDLLVESSSN